MQSLNLKKHHDPLNLIHTHTHALFNSHPNPSARHLLSCPSSSNKRTETFFYWLLSPEPPPQNRSKPGSVSEAGQDQSSETMIPMCLQFSLEESNETQRGRHERAHGTANVGNGDAGRPETGSKSRSGGILDRRAGEKGVWVKFNSLVKCQYKIERTCVLTDGETVDSHRVLCVGYNVKQIL